MTNSNETKDRVPYSAEFKQRVRNAFPDEAELHELLDNGSWEVIKHLSGSMAFGFAPEEVLAIATEEVQGPNPDHLRLMNVMKAAANRLEKELVCDEFAEDYQELCAKLRERAVLHKPDNHPVPDLDR